MHYNKTRYVWNQVPTSTKVCGCIFFVTSTLDLKISLFVEILGTHLMCPYFINSDLQIFSWFPWSFGGGFNSSRLFSCPCWKLKKIFHRSCKTNKVFQDQYIEYVSLVRFAQTGNLNVKSNLFFFFQCFNSNIDETKKYARLKCSPCQIFCDFMYQLTSVIFYPILPPGDFIALTEKKEARLLNLMAKAKKAPFVEIKSCSSRTDGIGIVVDILVMFKLYEYYLFSSTKWRKHSQKF